MAQKKIAKVEEVSEDELEDEQPSSFLSAFFKNLKEALFGDLVSNIKENIKEKLRKIEKKVVRNITSYIFFFIGVIFLSLSFIFSVEYYFGLHWFWGFLISGLLFMLISLIFKWLANRE